LRPSSTVAVFTEKRKHTELRHRRSGHSLLGMWLCLRLQWQTVGWLFILTKIWIVRCFADSKYALHFCIQRPLWASAHFCIQRPLCVWFCSYDEWSDILFHLLAAKPIDPFAESFLPSAPLRAVSGCGIGLFFY
jgi:lipopolysaccharide biosynthesis glycosyltransferase